MAPKAIHPLRLALAAAAVLLAEAAARAQGIPLYPSTSDPNAPLTLQPGGDVTLDGNFDPYADPFQNPGPILQDGALGPGVVTEPDLVLGEVPRLRQQTTLEQTLLANNDLGLHKLEVTSAFALGTSFQLAPVILTPGFAAYFWEGPAGTASLATPDMPPSTFDAYLDIGWKPQILEWLSAELGVTPGVHADFNETNSDSIRVRGRGLILFNYSPGVQIVFGLLYLDRQRVKLLPAGGVIWTPDADTRWEILFPQPRLAQRLTTIGNTDLWWYVGGEYGGGSWTIERASGARDAVDYNDLRVYLGLEFLPCGGLTGYSGYVELGLAWERELFYASGATPTFEPDETLMFRSGLRF